MKITPSDQKLRGGYYTPPAIADFLASWAVRSPSDHILEPSCGDGEIACAAARRLRALRRNSAQSCTIAAIELEATEARKARRRLSRVVGNEAVKVINRDFFEQCRRWGVGTPLFAAYEPFDAVVGNPPFVRYQNFPESHRGLAFELMQAIGLNPSKLTNAWVPFVIMAAQLLNDNGRLAMVLPSELLQVSYASETRQYLSQFFERLSLVTFRDLVFGGIQQDIVLLLGERRTDGEKGIAVFELNNISELEALAIDDEGVHPAELNHGSEKWLQYFLDGKQIELLRSIRSRPDLLTISDIAEVDVGLVTGENSFFVLSSDVTEQLQLWPTTSRIVSRSAHVKGLQFQQSDWEDCLRRQQRVLFFCPPNEDKRTLPKSAALYIENGEKAGLNQGYKCRIRKRWWVVPSQWVPDAFGLRQVHMYPKLVLNQADAQVTDTLHRIRFRPGTSPTQIASAFVNSLTLATSEVMGRGYGGGVLTFEPSELEALPIPTKGASDLDIESLDHLIRANNVYACLEITDKVLLQDGLGLSRRDVLRLRRSWETLRDRRIERRASGASAIDAPTELAALTPQG